MAIQPAGKDTKNSNTLIKVLEHRVVVLLHLTSANFNIGTWTPSIFNGRLLTPKTDIQQVTIALLNNTTAKI